MNPESIEVTREQFERFCSVQESGKCNMVSEEAQRQTGLTPQVFDKILKNYQKLDDLYKKKEETVMGEVDSDDDDSDFNTDDEEEESDDDSSEESDNSNDDDEEEEELEPTSEDPSSKRNQSGQPTSKKLKMDTKK